MSSKPFETPFVVAGNPEERRKLIKAENDRRFLANLTEDQRGQELERRFRIKALKILAISGVILATLVIAMFMWGMWLTSQL
ncbi:hypothetical protein AAVH_08581 [Aphelenchoides avenae]|nr:hypothetical protein AAVH_08581 [Aphelenchus avenae]